MKDNNNLSENWDLENFKTDGRHAIIGGILAALVVMAGSWMIGQTSNSEARYLLEMTLPNVRSFSGTLMLALGTILALMLTLLGLSTSSDTELKWTHYQRVKQIAWLDMLTFIVAVLVYLLLNVPIQETDSGTGEWFHILYYATLVVSSILAGAIITIILMLYNTVRDIIHAIGHPENESRIIHTEEE
jgi:glycerol uptake facilitator-like aquaporin